MQLVKKAPLLKLWYFFYLILFALAFPPHAIPLPQKPPNAVILSDAGGEEYGLDLVHLRQSLLPQHPILRLEVHYLPDELGVQSYLLLSFNRTPRLRRSGGLIIRAKIQTQPSHLSTEDLHLAEAGRGGAVSGVGDLHGLALTAVGRPPHPPVALVADGIATVPEPGGHIGVGGVLEGLGLLPALNAPGDLGGELEVAPFVVYGPGAVGVKE